MSTGHARTRIGTRLRASGRARGPFCYLICASAGLFAGAVLTGACERRARAPVRSEAPRSRESAGPLQIGPVASAAAFALVPAQGGALVIWAPPVEHGGGIVMRSLDALGVPRAPARRLVPADPPFAVTDLAAAATRDRLGVLFGETSASAQHARIKALLVALDASAPAEPLLLASGPAEPVGRGRLAVAAVDEQRIRLMYPAGAAECADSEHDGCVGYAFSELAGRSPRREPWLSVPRPCPEGAASLAGLHGRFFYAVCSWRQDAPSTMAYAINVDTYYARADEVLRGCAPLGMVAIDAGTVLLGADCGVMRRAARLSLDQSPAAEFPLADLALTCRGAQPAISASGLELELRDARGGLEAVLPDAIAPAGARAVWTGRALITAQRMSGALELQRHACEDGVLRNERGDP